MFKNLAKSRCLSRSKLLWAGTGLLGLVMPLALVPSARATECLLTSFSASVGEAGPAVAADLGGRFRAVWRQPPLTSGTGRADDIVVQSFTSACAPAGPTVVPTSSLNSAFPRHSDPSIGTNSAGHFTLGWTVADQDDGLHSATWRSTDVNPLILTADFAEVVVRGFNESVRTGILDGGESTDVFFRPVINGFERLSAEPCGSLTCRNSSPALDVDDSGNVVTAWLENGGIDEPFQNAIVARIFNVVGAATANIRVSPTYDSDVVVVGRPRVARLDNQASGASIVVWEQASPLLQPVQLMARIYSSSGAPVTSEFLVGQGGGAAVAPLGSQFVIMWARGEDVLSRSFDLAGSETTPESVVSELTGIKGRPALESFGTGLLALWESDIGAGTTGIYAATDILPELTPALHLAFNEGVGIFASDRIGNHAPAAIIGESAWTSAAVDEGIELEASDRIELDTSLAATAGRGTYSVWLRAPSTPTALGWVMGEKLSAGNKSWALAVNATYGHPGVLCQKNVTTGGGPFWITAPVDRTVVSEWTHVAAVFDQGETRLYIDGVLEKTGDECGASGTSLDRFTFGAFGAADGFVGGIDEAKYFTEALSDGQVMALFQATLAEASSIETLPPIQTAAGVSRLGPSLADVTVSTDEPAALHIELGPGAELGSVGPWSAQLSTSQLRNLSGLVPDLPYEIRLTSIDAAGNASQQMVSLSGTAVAMESIHLPLDEGSGNLTLELVSGVSQTISGTPGWTSGPIGAALDIDQGERIQISGAFVAATGYGAYGLWINPDAIQANNQFLISESVGGANAGWALTLSEHSGRLSVFFQSADGQTFSPFSIQGPVIPPGLWSHVAVSFEPLVTALYVDGVRVATGPTGGGFQTPQNLLVIGGAPHTPLVNLRFRGALDDIRVFDLPITEMKAASLFALGSP